ncbi:MAG: PDZ domain-containing protein, partial [Planctomycetaceae bacterium]|nr:PDZ domain-containing protein [Planctomycetaceae bacterium]
MNPHTTSSFLAGLSGTLLSAGLAAACPTADPSERAATLVARWEPRPQPTRADKPRADSGVTLTGQSSDLLIIRDGKVVTLRINGRILPTDRAKREGDSWVVRDENNAVLAQFPATDLGMDNTGEIRLESLRTTNNGGPRVTRSMRVLNGLPVTDLYADTESPAPKVMIGITMIPPSEDLLAHFGLDAQNVTLVGSVSPDTPAAKAGLKENDLITAIDGGKATADAVREVLCTKNPGDQIKLSVIQRGVQRELTITLAKRDETMLSAGGSRLRVFTDGDDSDTIPQGVPGLSPEQRESINQRVREALSKTRQQLEESERQMTEAQRQINQAQRNQGGLIFRDERNRDIY